ncbi:MAG: tetratricopeptide repeat protein [Woeseiaceae bacterium]
MEDLSEKEQLEAMRNWWRENGRFVITGIVLGIALLAGWNYWQNSQQTAELEASVLYEDLLGHVADGSLESAEQKANTLYQDYSATVYAAQARLAMARLFMDKGRDQDAAGALRDLLTVRGNSEIKQVARLRLARVLLYQDKPDEVIELLANQPDSAFLARYSEAKGDALVALGRYEEAAEAYAVAISENPDMATVDRTLVQMKINDLPEPGEVVAIDETMRPPADTEAEPASDQVDPAGDESAQ